MSGLPADGRKNRADGNLPSRILVTGTQYTFPGS